MPKARVYGAAGTSASPKVATGTFMTLAQHLGRHHFFFRAVPLDPANTECVRVYTHMYVALMLWEAEELPGTSHAREPATDSECTRVHTCTYIRNRTCTYIHTYTYIPMHICVL